MQSRKENEERYVTYQVSYKVPAQQYGVSPKLYLFYARRQCDALNNPYLHEKGLAISFDFSQ